MDRSCCSPRRPARCWHPNNCRSQRSAGLSLAAAERLRLRPLAAALHHPGVRRRFRAVVQASEVRRAWLQVNSRAAVPQHPRGSRLRSVAQRHQRLMHFAPRRCSSPRQRLPLRVVQPHRGQGQA